MDIYLPDEFYELAFERNAAGRDTATDDRWPSHQLPAADGFRAPTVQRHGEECADLLWIAI